MKAMKIVGLLAYYVLLSALAVLIAASFAALPYWFGPN
jgi:hypothetical protein